MDKKNKPLNKPFPAIVTFGLSAIVMWWSCHVYYMYYIMLSTDDLI